MVRSRLAAALGSLLVVACMELHADGFPCSTSGECPSGYSCYADGRCYDRAPQSDAGSAGTVGDPNHHGAGGTPGYSGAAGTAPLAGAGAGGTSHAGSGGSAGISAGGRGGTGSTGDPRCQQTFFGLAPAALDTCLAGWAARGYYLQTLAVAPNGATLAGSFRAGDNAVEVHALLTAAEFDSVTSRLATLGWVPYDITVASLSSGVSRYSAIWRRAEAVEVHVFRDVPRVQFEAAWDHYWENGYTLTDWFVHEAAGSYFSGTWQRLPNFTGFAAYYGLSQPEYDDLNVNLRAQGLTVTRFMARGITYPFAAIWRPVDWDSKVDPYSSPARVLELQQEFGIQGYWLDQLHAVDAETFASVWRRERGSTP